MRHGSTVRLLGAADHERPEQRYTTMVTYTAIIEKTSDGYSAYVPDLPGCVAAADTRSETGVLIEEAVALHLDMLRSQDEPIPEPATTAT